MENLNNKAFQEAIEKDDEAVIIDVRTAGEVAEGIIPGAINIDIFDPSNFENKMAELDKSKHYYVYCRSGNRSGQACRYMDAKGFQHTYNLMGGMNEWTGPVAAYQG